MDLSGLTVTLPMTWKVGSIGCSELGWHASGPSKADALAAATPEERWRMNKNPLFIIFDDFFSRPSLLLAGFPFWLVYCGINDEERPYCRPPAMLRRPMCVLVLLASMAACSAGGRKGGSEEEETDYYKILEVGKKATKQEVKKAYRAKAMQ